VTVTVNRSAVHPCLVATGVKHDVYPWPPADGGWCDPVPPRLKPALPGEYPMNDLMPQPNWPEGHAPKVPALIEALERPSEFVSVKLAWASGLMVVVRKSGLLLP
jgi:hypothetical protein